MARMPAPRRPLVTACAPSAHVRGKVITQAFPPQGDRTRVESAEISREQTERGNPVRAIIRRARRNGPQRGQTMAEYALVLAVITVGVLASVSALSGGIMSGIDTVSGLVDGIV